MGYDNRQITNPSGAYGAYTFSTLPTAAQMSGYASGTTAYTSDLGPVFWDARTGVWGVGGGGGSGVTYGALLTYTSAAGSSNNVNPSGMGSKIGRLDITLSGADSTWTGFSAGYDGQTVKVRNLDSTYNLIFSNQNASSLAANRFYAQGDIVVGPGANIDMTYYAGTVNNWLLST